MTIQVILPDPSDTDDGTVYTTPGEGAQVCVDGTPYEWECIIIRSSIHSEQSITISPPNRAAPVSASQYDEVDLWVEPIGLLYRGPCRDMARMMEYPVCDGLRYIESVQVVITRGAIDVVEQYRPLSLRGDR